MARYRGRAASDRRQVCGVSHLSVTQSRAVHVEKWRSGVGCALPGLTARRNEYNATMRFWSRKAGKLR